MRLRSSAFADGAAIPRRFTCDGEDISPPLQWDDPPSQTLSFALLCVDPDAPAGTWHHWAAYDIPADRRGLAEGAGASGGKDGLSEAVNDFGRDGYGGPCPPPRHGPHHYHFRLLALGVAHLRVAKRSSFLTVEREARKHMVAEAVLTGLYERH
jgi:hypothetical protein